VAYQVINKHRLLAIGEKLCLSYRKGALYVHRQPEDKPEFLLKLPDFSFMGTLSLAERFFRLAPRCAVALENGSFLISFHGGVYCVDPSLKKIRREHTYREGMNHPLGFCKIQNISGFENSIAYGEYWGNLKNEEVAIYCRGAAGWEKACSFSPGQIKHIHGLFPDPYRQQVLILTGDANLESGIWSGKDQFQLVRPLVYGDQQARACVLFPLPQGLLYASDTPLEENFLFFAEEKEGAWKTEKIMPLPGPVIFGTKYELQEGEAGFAFATSVEPDPEIKGLGYFLSCRLAKGVKDRYSHVIGGNLEKGFHVLCSFRKDRLPMALFQFGNVLFPSGGLRGQLFMCPQSLAKYNGKTLKWQ